MKSNRINVYFFIHHRLKCVTFSCHYLSLLWVLKMLRDTFCIYFSHFFTLNRNLSLVLKCQQIFINIEKDCKTRRRKFHTKTSKSNSFLSPYFPISELNYFWFKTFLTSYYLFSNMEIIFTLQLSVEWPSRIQFNLINQVLPIQNMKQNIRRTRNLYINFACFGKINKY